MQEREFDTKVIHSEYDEKPRFGAAAVSIYETAAYLFGATNESDRLFAEHDINKLYTRTGNPTVGVLEQRLADIDRGIASVCYASGMAAIRVLFTTLLNAGVTDDMIRLSGGIEAVDDITNDLSDTLNSI